MHRGTSGSKSSLFEILKSQNTNRADRRYKECQMMYDEEKANSTRLQDQINSLNSKNRTLKRNLDDTVSKNDCTTVDILLCFAGE